jgi:hypothetical protein
MSDKVKRKWRKLHKEELHNLNSSPEFITVINFGRMGLARQAAGTEEMKNA